MHKTYLNKKELEIINGAGTIVEKIGGFPSMENGCLESILVKRSGGNQFRNDVELLKYLKVYNCNKQNKLLEAHNHDKKR